MSEMMEALTQELAGLCELASMLEDVAPAIIDDEHWTTADGRRLTAREMTDPHLLNTVRYIRRRALLWRQKALELYDAGELDELPEGLAEMGHDEIARLRYDRDVLGSMLRECERRGFGNVRSEIMELPR